MEPQTGLLENTVVRRTVQVPCLFWLGTSLKVNQDLCWHTTAGGYKLDVAFDPLNNIHFNLFFYCVCHLILHHDHGGTSPLIIRHLKKPNNPDSKAFGTLVFPGLARLLHLVCVCVPQKGAVKGFWGDKRYMLGNILI